MEISWEGFQKIGKFPKGETLNGKFREKKKSNGTEIPAIPGIPHKVVLVFENYRIYCSIQH